jgi:hypothetical protein
MAVLKFIAAPAPMQTKVRRVREERLVFGGIEIVIRVSAEDSGGAMMAHEEVPATGITCL